MSDLLETANTWLSDVMQAHAGATITYTRGDTELSLTATIGETATEQSDTFGAQLYGATCDFIVVAADMVANGQQIVPADGDRITVGAVTYEVNLGGNLDPWRWGDPYQKTIRIHTRRLTPAEG